MCLARETSEPSVINKERKSPISLSIVIVLMNIKKNRFTDPIQSSAFTLFLRRKTFIVEQCNVSQTKATKIFPCLTHSRSSCRYIFTAKTPTAILCWCPRRWKSVVTATNIPHALKRIYYAHIRLIKYEHNGVTTIIVMKNNGHTNRRMNDCLFSFGSSCAFPFERV